MAEPVAVLGTRAVARLVEAGSMDECPWCEDIVRFRGKHKTVKVIANCYDGARWDRLEVFHEPCYVLAGEPYGPADRSKLPKLLRGVL